MRIDVRTVGNVHILDCMGKITVGWGALTIRNAVRDELTGGASKILLNLSNAECIDEAGFAELVVSHTTARKQGVQLKFLDTTKRIHGMFLAAKFCTVFEVFDSEQAAIDSFGGIGL